MFLSVRELKKSFGKDEVLKQLSVDVEAQSTLSILGKSGCGKTTFLKILAGLESQDHGSIELNGTEISQRPPQKRGVVYLYQEPLLFPHLNAFDNIAFGLRIQKVDADAIEDRVASLLKSLGLSQHALKMPDQLSGGQKQRVAFGRAIIVNPLLLLLDEPFASLDVETRATMQHLFKDISNQFGITSIFVTHDLKEALLMGDKIAYMQQGHITTYSSKQAFINDPKVGVLKEISFWSNLVQSTSNPE